MKTIAFLDFFLQICNEYYEYAISDAFSERLFSKTHFKLLVRPGFSKVLIIVCTASTLLKTSLNYIVL